MRFFAALMTKPSFRTCANFSLSRAARYSTQAQVGGSERSRPLSDSVKLTGRNGTRLSAFTGKPDFYEALFFLDDIMLHLAPLKSSSSLTAGQSIQWHDKEALSDALGFALSNLQYRKIRDKLGKLAMHGHLPEIRQFLSNFTSSATAFAAGSSSDGSTAVGESAVSKPPPNLKSYYGRIDKEGKAVATGSRKSATAKVMLVPGEGLLYVNGVPMTEHFKRWSDRFKLAEPFRVTSTWGKYNAWALVRGGGFTGARTSFQPESWA